jgi:pectate lyase
MKLALAGVGVVVGCTQASTAPPYAGPRPAVTAPGAGAGSASASSSASASGSGSVSASGSAAAAALTSGTGPAAASAALAGLPAFPGAEGMGALTTGGRGGSVCTVTSMATSGAGTLAACLATRGPVTIVFARGGVVQGPIEITRPDVTIAGHTAPGGVTIAGGLVCDNVYTEGSDCRNLVLRHLRLRAADGDGLRLGGARDVIVDHVSIGGARDEAIEISRSQRITVQHTLVAEPVGDHWRWGGVLLNYSTTTAPLDAISLHHMIWNGVAGRLPEVSCEENDDAPGSACAGHRIELDLVSNLLFDVSDPIWHNRCVGTNEGNDCAVSARNVQLGLRLLANQLVRRSSADEDAPLIEASVAAVPASTLEVVGNQVCRGARCVAATVPGATSVAIARVGTPAITITPADQLASVLGADAGAWPRDAMDRRVLGYLAGAPGSVDRRPAAWASEQGIDRGDALVAPAADPAPPDGDGDGMSDEWERARGLDPAAAGASASGAAVCGAGYTMLECYLAELDLRRRGR